jgi:hypothetical protein
MRGLMIATKAAQAEIRKAFVGGGPGAVVSALVWFLGAATLSQTNLRTAFTVLFFGGMLIFPVTTVICRVGFGRSASVKGNPLGLVVLESTFAMIAGLIAAWLLLASQPDATIPVAVLAVGAHYFSFRTAYGATAYWVLGAILSALGCVGLFVLPGRNFELMIAFATIELIFGLWMIPRQLRPSP